MPNYLRNQARIFDEEFVAQATNNDKRLGPIIKLIQKMDWEDLRKVSLYFYSLERDLSITPSGRRHFVGQPANHHFNKTTWGQAVR